MNIDELCEKYGLSKTTVMNGWPRTQKSILKKYGVYIEKIGKGVKADYKEITTDDRALTMYEETKEEMIMDRSALSYESAEFNLFLAIVMTQFMTFRGTYTDLVKYMGLKVNKNNIALISDSLERLVEKKIVEKYDDRSTGEGYFVVHLVRKAEVEMKIGIDMVKTCKQIADENNKRDYIPLLKTWLGVQIMSENQPFKMSDLEELTGLSPYQARESKKLLEQNELFKTSKAYKSFKQCIGQNVDLNAFYNKME